MFQDGQMCIPTRARARPGAEAPNMATGKEKNEEKKRGRAPGLSARRPGSKQQLYSVMYSV